MKNYFKSINVLCLASVLSSCVIDNDPGLDYQKYSYQDTNIYSQQSYYSINYFDAYHKAQSNVSVPDSYYVGATHSPASFKDRDKNWVNTQNPQNYTIELAKDKQAAKVAQKLYKAPKNEHTAQVKYNQNGNAYYKGVYGSFQSPEEAEKALQNLPPEVKEGAEVKSWSKVQEHLSE